MQALRDIDRVKETWARHHPNILLLLVWLGGLALQYGIVFAIASLSANPTLSSAESTLLSPIIPVFTGIAYTVGLIITNGWVLKQKGRSPHWLWCYLFMGLIPIVVALLPRKGNRT